MAPRRIQYNRQTVLYPETNSRYREGEPESHRRALGSVYNIGNATPYTWSGVPVSTDGSNLIWFLMVTTDASRIEGSWGVSRNAQGVEAERMGPGTNGASGTCAPDKSVANACGHTAP